MLTVAELAAFLDMMGGVQILTLNDADADPASDETFIRDQLHAIVKCRKAGRPRNPQGERERRREICWELVREWHYVEDLGYKSIRRRLSKETGFSLSIKSIQNWIKEEPREGGILLR